MKRWNITNWPLGTNSHSELTSVSRWIALKQGLQIVTGQSHFVAWPVQLTLLESRVSDP